MTKYLIIALALSLSYGVWQSRRATFNGNERDRYKHNYIELKDDNNDKDILLSEKEMEKGLLEDSLKMARLDLLNIKPDKVIEYVEIEVVDTLYLPSEAEITPIDSTTYAWKDKVECFEIEGLVKIDSGTPKIIVTNRIHTDVVSYIFYTERDRVKWIPFKPKWGKKNEELEVLSDCGNAKYVKFSKVKRGSKIN